MEGYLQFFPYGLECPNDVIKPYVKHSSSLFGWLITIFLFGKQLGDLIHDSPTN